MPENLPHKAVLLSSAYLKDLKGYKGWGKKRYAALENVIREVVHNHLSQRKTLPPKFKNHPIAHKHLGNCHDCHLYPDTILLYRMNSQAIELLRLGSHANLGLG